MGLYDKSIIAQKGKRPKSSTCTLTCPEVDYQKYYKALNIKNTPSL
jgi:hypothetical protein